jgi:hypothetical protein
LAVVSIAGIQGMFENNIGLKITKNIKIISIKISEVSKSSLIIESLKIGELNSIQISYLIYNKNFEKSFGVWFWT